DQLLFRVGVDDRTAVGDGDAVRNWQSALHTGRRPHAHALTATIQASGKQRVENLSRHPRALGHAESVSAKRYAAGFLSTIRLPSSSTESPVLRASVTTDGCQSTLPASGPPMIAISSASVPPERLRKPR